MKTARRALLPSKNGEGVKSKPVRSKANLRKATQLSAGVSSRHARSLLSSQSGPKSEKSRDLILLSAARLFYRQGFSATTLRQIASLAKIKAGSIYYYFDSKEDLLDEVLDRGLRHVFESVKKAVKQAGTESQRRRIGRAIEAHLVALLETSDFTSANIRIYGQLPEHLKKPHRPLRRAYAKYWDRLFLDARRAGELRADIEIIPLRIFVIGALNWTIEWFRLGNRDAVIKLARRTELLIFEGVRNA
jgi:TetR/AcrR family transcriptional regulator, cholesterol catabolism regulator